MAAPLIPTRDSAFHGAMLGLAIGDALAYPCEFRGRATILAAFGPAGVTDMVALHDPRWPERPIILGRRHPPGTYTDDTQMTIAVAEALLEVASRPAAGGADIEAIMQAMAARFVAWSRAEDNDRAPGHTCMTACERLAEGAPWREAGVADSKGCGSAMRVAPIGLRFHRDHAQLLEVARASSLITHGHDAALEGAAAAALLVALALAGASPEDMYRAVADACCPRSADFDACWARLPALLDAPPEVALSEAGLGEGWVAEEAVASALYCVWRTPDDLRQTILTAANTDGDSDSIACIAGGISGARNGVEAIPASWCETLENAARLVEIADALHAACGG
jgi:ADP-ribosylglycohydrolase